VLFAVAELLVSTRSGTVKSNLQCTVSAVSEQTHMQKCNTVSEVMILWQDRSLHSNIIVTVAVKIPILCFQSNSEVITSKISYSLDKLQNK